MGRKKNVRDEHGNVCYLEDPSKIKIALKTRLRGLTKKAKEFAHKFGKNITINVLEQSGALISSIHYDAWESRNNTHISDVIGYIHDPAVRASMITMRSKTLVNKADELSRLCAVDVNLRWTSEKTNIEMEKYFCFNESTKAAKRSYSLVAYSLVAPAAPHANDVVDSWCHAEGNAVSLKKRKECPNYLPTEPKISANASIESGREEDMNQESTKLLESLINYNIEELDILWHQDVENSEVPPTERSTYFQPDAQNDNHDSTKQSVIPEQDHITVNQVSYTQSEIELDNDYDIFALFSEKIDTNANDTSLNIVWDDIDWKLLD